MIFVVLGMHKSGTTLVSQILHHSGINMGDFNESVSYDEGNKYERASALDLDMALLGAEDDRVMKLKSRRRVQMDDELRSRMRRIISECENEHADWGFKDPRSLLLYDLWAEELPEHKIIAVFRSPSEVWPRFRWKMGKYYRNFHQAYAYLTIWQDHNLNLVKYLESTPMDHILLDYRDLMSGGGAFELLKQFTGRDLADKRKPGLYRSKARKDIFLFVADVLMKIRNRVSIGDTLARLNSLKTPLGS